MMKEILITSSALILALLVLRRVFKGVLSRRFQYALWALVLVRLLVPMNLLPASDFSVLTAAKPVEQAVAARVNQPLYFRPQGQVSPAELSRRDIAVENIPTAQDGFVLAVSDGLPVEGFDYPATEWLVRDPETNTVTRYADMTVGPWNFLDAVWKVGMALIGGFFLLSNLQFYLRLRRKRRPYATLFEGGTRRVYLVPDGVIPSPCLFGHSIYITPAVAGDENKLRHVLAHETTHAKHLDPLWSLLRCVCLMVYWFDPLVWVAAACSKADCELACDESVLCTLGEHERIPYGQTLLSLIPVKRVSNPMLAATTMTAGKKQLTDRVSRIAGRPRQLIAAALVVAVLAGVVSACTFTGAKPEAAPDPTESQEPQGLRALTGEELRWFNEEFFNGQTPEGWDDYHIRNQFINSVFNLYDRPENIDLFQLFYCDGDMYDNPENDFCPSYKITEAQINATLTQYTGLTLEQTNKVGLENFTYQDGAYTWSHGDTNYPGDIEIICGTREGNIVKLYHHGWGSGSTWYCTTLEEQPDGGYWFKSNRESEAPAIPTPLPAWEPEAVISLKDLKPYVAPTVTAEAHPNHYSYSYETCYANWNIDDHHVMVYRASDDVVYAAYVENDVYYVFQSGLEGKSDCVFFYHDLLGHDGFWLDYYGFYEGSNNFWPIRDYYYFDPNGVLTLLARCETGYDGVDPSMLDLDGDGKPELISPQQLFFTRDGTIYQARLRELVKEACPELSYWDYAAWDRYSKCLYLRGYTEDYREWERYLYFDGKSLLIYKNEKPTHDHMVDGADEGVPAAVVEEIRDFAERAYTDAQIEAKEAHLQGLINSTDGDLPLPEYDDWRVESISGPYTYSHGGATVEGWQFNYELHTITPENVVLAGGRYITEDNWVSPGYPGCDALFFVVENGEYRFLNWRMVQEDMYSYYIDGVVLGRMEANGVELPDGSTYPQLNFRKHLDYLTDSSLAGCWFLA